MKIFIDKNVLISGFVFGGKTGELLKTLIRSEHELILSDYVPSELHDFLNSMN